MVKKIHDWQEKAYAIRAEGDCPDCGAPCLLSYLMPEFTRVRANGEEDCGYYCECCGWGNGGSRQVGGRFEVNDPVHDDRDYERGEHPDE